MSTLCEKDRASLCSFTFADGRRCRMPRRDGHPYLCTFHSRREAKAFAGEKIGEEIARYLSGEPVPASDLCFALGRLFAAVAQGQVEAKTVAALANLSQSLVHTLHLDQSEPATRLPSTQPSPINPRYALPNPRHRQQRPERRVAPNPHKIPDSPNPSESTLAKL